MAQHRGIDQRAVLNPHAMVGFVATLEAAQDRDGLLDGGLADVDRLKPPLEGRVGFDVLTILIQRGGPDAAQLATGQSRLEHVARRHRAFGGAGPDDRVQLVDKEDDLAFGRSDFSQNRFEALLELAAELGPGKE